MSRAFPLAGLLRVRERAEERAAAELAQARREAEAARARRHATSEALAGSQLADGPDRLAFVAAVASRSALSLLLSEAERELATADELVADHAVQWSFARRQVRAIDRLAERHDETERRLDAQAEQAALDEVAGRRATTDDTTQGDPS